jgi:aspartate 1-decarboxylase
MKTQASSNMYRVMFKSKIDRATLTGKALDYEGSIALDRCLMDAADLLPGEQVQVLNVNTGDRLVTYVIESPAASGTVMLNGPAARLGEVGDPLIIIAYAFYPEAEAPRLKPRIVRVDKQNAPVTQPAFSSDIVQPGTLRAVQASLNAPEHSAGETRV